MNTFENAKNLTLLRTMLTAGALCVAGCDVEEDPAIFEDDAEMLDDHRLAGVVEPDEPQTMLIRYWNGPTMRGSATLVAPNVLLTNAHAAFGGAAGMYIQRGTTTMPGVDTIQVQQNLHHPNYSSPGDDNDLALLRLGCNVTDINPARINRLPLGDSDLGSDIEAVGYGPTSWGGTDWGTKRSTDGALSWFSLFKVGVSGVSAYPGDSGGSLYGYPLGEVGNDDGGVGGAESAKKAIFPIRKLIGVLTFSSGTSVLVDPHSHWIDDTIDQWEDPNLPMCPCDDPCPAGGYYDGANCQMGEAPAGTTAFIWGDAYYHTPLPGNQCPLPGSFFDGANCWVDDVPEGMDPFIWANHWYYSAVCESW